VRVIAPRKVLKSRWVLLIAGLLATTPLVVPFVLRGEALIEGSIATWPVFVQRAHSHNDYQQKRPLHDAVDAGLNSVEVDLWLENGTLLVGHDRGKWRGDFETLYLQPLAQLYEDGKLPLAADHSFLLWLDIKDGNAAFGSALYRLLEAQPWARRPEPQGARIEVVLTGNADAKEAYVKEHASPSVTRDSNTFLEDDPPASPGWRWYALDWRKLSAWKGTTDMPEEDRIRLHALVARIHGNGRKLRLWNHPATLRFWQEAVDAGVDRIGTDSVPKPSE
jgi:hypothetical protein